MDRLPAELIHRIAYASSDAKTVVALATTCRSFHAILLGSPYLRNKAAALMGACRCGRLGLYSAAARALRHIDGSPDSAATLIAECISERGPIDPGWLDLVAAAADLFASGPAVSERSFSFLVLEMMSWGIESEVSTIVTAMTPHLVPQTAYNLLLTAASLGSPSGIYATLPLAALPAAGDDAGDERMLVSRKQLEMALRVAAEGSSEEVALVLLDACLLTLSPAECTRVLAAAAGSDMSEVVAILLEDGRADPTYIDSAPLQVAAERGFVEIVDLFLADCRADPAADESASLRWATRRGHVAVVAALIADGACVCD
ncbi:uncharacterized protein AMSG_10654 [Thecamonas trahens ATCC 50062]|uniref:Uncharacterized protein n=1 Tax=Thecamonas trahens ATCC 50062 TaxID=461836 RepID=A0A0L0DU93_THETB|nr:hypothetical protein AMSG_10654 [Thecamonas trahens ATCC 50062]KNC55058.1 hypothetical protein AMSG_10654 [Thecamonas trahens ATCC 50062]|eukprot:XP_013753362.1 hypothetical protein AMSG_10654 [Thecamonas trahens ATCC 50062]